MAFRLKCLIIDSSNINWNGLKTAVILKVCSDVQDIARNWFLEETSLGKEDYCDLH